MKRWPIFFLLTILFFLHFYRLSDIPPGLSNDEANIGYEAWSIATTGRDQWGNFLPLVFQGFGNWSLPVYIYLTTPFVWILGPTILAVRAVSALSFLGIVLLVYAIVKKLRPQIAFSVAIMAAVTPWIYGLTRVANEVPLAITFFLLAIYSFLLSRRRQMLIVFSLAFMVLAMMTYYGVWIFAITYIFVLGYFYWRGFVWNKINLLSALAVVLTGTILIYQVTVNQRGNARLNQVNLMNDRAIVGQLNAERGACNDKFYPLICKLLFNRPGLFIREYTSNYLSHFSFRDWFIVSANKGILPPGGYFFTIQAPLLMIGLWYLVSKGNRLEKIILFPWLLLAPVADSLTGSGNFTRSFMIAPIIAIIGAYGLHFLPRFISFIIYILIIVSFARFMLSYTSYFPRFNSIYTHYEYQPLMEYMKGKNELPIFISSRFRDTKQYIFYLFYQNIEPSIFQNKLLVEKETEKDGWIWVKRAGNWNFVKSLPSVTDLPTQSYLIGAAKEEIMPLIEQYRLCNGVQLEPMTTVDFLNKDPAFSVVKATKLTDDICFNLR